jgi:hypothetical protein
MKRAGRAKPPREGGSPRIASAANGDSGKRKGRLKPAGLPWISAAVHVTLAILIGGSILILLMASAEGQDGAGLLASWVKTSGSVVESLGMERRRPYVLAMLGAFTLPPFAAGWWDGRCAMSGRGSCAMRVVAPLAALLCVALYATAVQVIMQNNTDYITIMAGNHIWFSHVLVSFYGVLYIPVAFIAAHVVRQLQYGLQV